jgi:hypothetical protein
MNGERRYAGRSLMDKLGVKPGSRVSVLGISDGEFVKQLHEQRADVSGRLRKESDLVFLGVRREGELARLEDVELYLRRDGAVWVAYPKGRKDLREVDVIEAGLAAGFVDNKVVRFSDTHTALRFVIPLARR